MISKDTLKHVMLSNQKEIEQYQIVPRKIPAPESQQIVFVGVRRAGKSFMLYQKMQELLISGYSWKDMLYLNFEEDRLTGFSLEDFDKILEAHHEMYGGKPMLFLDEIQNITGWEKFARRMADTKSFVWITGSNQKMLSKDIQSTLGGRYTTKEVYPYSFGEYLNANGIEYNELSTYGIENKASMIKHWNDYLFWGGMPQNAQLPAESPVRRDYLRDTYRKVYLSDIANRYGISQNYTNRLRLLLKKMAESVHQPETYSNFRKAMSSVDGTVTVPTVSSWINGCEDAWLILRLRNISSHFSEKETSCKYYFVDNGFLNLHLTDGKAALLENAVALTLFRKYGHDSDNQRVFFYRNNVEVDFYIPEDNLAIQASYSIYGNQSTYDREVGALTKFSNFKPGCKRLILTNDESGTIKDDFGEIEVHPLWKWILLQEVSILKKKSIVDNHSEIKILREKIVLGIIDRASDKIAKSFSPELRELLLKYKSMIPAEDCKIHFESLWKKAEIILNADGVNKAWMKDAHQELMDFAEGKIRGLSGGWHR